MSYRNAVVAVVGGKTLRVYWARPKTNRACGWTIIFILIQGSRGATRAEGRNALRFN